MKLQPCSTMAMSRRGLGPRMIREKAVIADWAVSNDRLAMLLAGGDQ
jgi:hypothetical protein